MLLDFGQPLDGLVQAAYVVADIAKAQEAFSTHLRIGPWFVRERFVPPQGRLRGLDNRPTLTLARGFSGHTMIELIAQHDDGPSIYHEHVGERRYGFHHWAVMTRNFDAHIAQYLQSGFAEAYYDVLPSGSRVMYVDSTSQLPGMIEVIEYTAEQEQVYAEMYRAAVGWHRSQGATR